MNSEKAFIHQAFWKSWLRDSLWIHYHLDIINLLINQPSFHSTNIYKGWMVPGPEISQEDESVALILCLQGSPLWPWIHLLCKLDVSTSHCSSKPKISNEEAIGIHGWSHFSQKSCCSIPSTLLRIQVQFSLSWQWRLWCLTLQKGERKGNGLQKGWPQKPWDHAKPQQHGLVFPLYSPRNQRVDFSDSFSLPRLHPALGSWQCQHSHPGITVKIASFFLWQ